MANTEKITVKVGAFLLPWNIFVELNDDPFDLTNYTPTLRIETEDGTVVQAGASVTKHPTQTFTAEADDDLITCNRHGLKDGQQIVVANSGGALPTGLSASTPYFVVNATPNKFSLSTLPDGPAINLTTDGSGTNTFYRIGSLQYQPVTGDVTSARNLRGWVIVTSGSDPFTFPADGHIPIEIQAVGN